MFVNYSNYDTINIETVTGDLGDYKEIYIGHLKLLVHVPIIDIKMFN